MTEERWNEVINLNATSAFFAAKAVIPKMLEKGSGVIVNVTSIAGHTAYAGGGGYNAAKFAAHALTEVLRLELNGEPLRVIEVAPGMVKTDEFSLTRFGGDAERAAKVYAGVPDPLTAEDIADCVAWVAGRPAHVNIDRMTVRPRAQAAQHKVYRVAQDPS
jgi:NADP-dependent 3-hydroxy acid dehydrogenase YdfG